MFQWDFMFGHQGSSGNPAWALSQGYAPTGYPVGAPVSYQTYRQLPGWDLHPPMILRRQGALSKRVMTEAGKPPFLSPIPRIRTETSAQTQRPSRY